MRQENHRPSFHSDDIIRSFRRNVPECYVRDYRPNSSWLAICRGYKAVTDFSLYEKGAPTEITVPKDALCFIPQGTVTATTYWDGMKLVRPGWRNQLRKAGEKITEAQRRRISKDLGVDVFSRY